MSALRLRTWANTLLLVAATLLAAPTFAADSSQPEATADALLDNLQAGQFKQAVLNFTPQMFQALPAAQLEHRWTSLSAQVGPLQQRGAPKQTAEGKYTQLIVPLHFAHGDLAMLLSVNAQGQIAGLLLQGLVTPAPPPPADARYSERPMDVVGLPGTLTLPAGKGPFAAVVLVHGSGPQDQDETIGTSRPFLDVARGLAAHGIAVLRYEKRTHARPQEVLDTAFGVDRETTDDAVAALALLATTPSIDARHVYVMGHSQGGMLAPRIAARSGKAAGIILWAAPGRPLLDLVADQTRYVLALDGDDSDQDKAQIAKIESQIAQIRSDAAPDPHLMGLPSSYWRDADRVDPIADLAQLSRPVLWLQGGRDFQVTAPDWARWKQALAGNTQATEHFYPALNHLGIAAGTGPGNPAEYQQPGHVDPQLIDDVARWINARPSQ